MNRLGDGGHRPFARFRPVQDHPEPLTTVVQTTENLFTMKGTLGIPTIQPGGKLGNVVFIRTAEGYVVRERVTPANPRTAAQTRARRGFSVASQSWGQISDEAFEAWNAFGRSLGRTGQLAYMSLTRKWLAVHPDGVPPEFPPSGPFFGDACRLTVSDSRMAISKEPSQIVNDELSTLSILSDRPNSTGVVTEILLQSLPNARRKPKAREWRTVGFYGFTSGGLEIGIPVAAGAWAVAYRFVDGTTGQETPLAVLGAVTI